MKKFLFVIKDAPHGTGFAQEMQDMLLAAGTLEQSVSLLFLGAGVLQLKRDQQPDNIQRKNFAAAWQALELYDIEQVFVATSALQDYGLTSTDLLVPAKTVNADEIGEIFNQQTIIL